MAVALTFATARRIGEAERFLRADKYKGWLPTLFLGELLLGKTLAIIGAGRIGEAYARMMVEGHKMNLIYFDIHQNKALEDYVSAYATSWTRQGMATLATANVAAILQGFPVWGKNNIMPFLEEDTPRAAPSILNAEELDLPIYNHVGSLFD